MKKFLLSLRNKIFGSGQVVYVLENNFREISDSLNRLHEEMAEQTKKLAGLEDEIERLKASTLLHDRRELPLKPPIKVLFLVHNGEAWAALDEVFHLMEKDPLFQVQVASIPRHYPGADTYENEELTHKILQERAIPHMRFCTTGAAALAAVKMLGPDVIFRQSQWERDIWPDFSADNLRFARLCYVPYEVIPFPLPDDHYPPSLKRFFESCWRIYIQKEPYETAHEIQDNFLREYNFRYTGTPKPKYVQNLKNRPVQEGGKPPFQLLWSAHHSLNEYWCNFGVFPSICEPMLEWAQQAQDIHFAFSPHPALVSLGEHGCEELSQEQWQSFLDRWNQLPNTSVVSGSQNDDAFRNADVLLIDGVSWLLEFQFLNKPVIHLERQDSYPYSQTWKDIMKGVHSCKTLAEAIEKIGHFKRGGADEKLAFQKINCRSFIDENAAQAILDDIKESLINGKSSM